MTTGLLATIGETAGGLAMLRLPKGAPSRVPTSVHLANPTLTRCPDTISRRRPPVIPASARLVLPPAVILELPLATMRAPTAGVILRLVRPRYLIVDDSPAFLSAARNLLEHQGLAVVGVAANVCECLRSVDQLAPDVILVDVDLGNDSGFDLARRLTRRGIRAEVIFISMHAADDYADLVASSGAAGFVAKSDLSKAAIERALIEAPESGRHRVEGPDRR